MHSVQGHGRKGRWLAWALLTPLFCVGPKSALGGLFGCDSDAAVRRPPQRMARRVLRWLASIPTGQPPHSELMQMIDTMNTYLVTLSVDSTTIVHEPTQAATLVHNNTKPLPCIPAIIMGELMQAVWMWKVEGQEEPAATFFEASGKYVAWIRSQAWADLVNLGFGDMFAALQMLCSIAPAPPEEVDDDADARLRHNAWPEATVSGATVLKQFHTLVKFDYRECVRRFLGADSHAPADCAGPGARRETRPRRTVSRIDLRQAARRQDDEHGALWPHWQLGILATRQPWACGLVCRQASSFSLVAQALLLQGIGKSGRRRVHQQDDFQHLLRAAHAEILAMEPAFWVSSDQSEGLQVKQTCSLARTFPVYAILSQFAGIGVSPSKIAWPRGAQDGQDRKVMKKTTQPPPLDLAYGCDDVSGWPPVQRLKREGAMVIYNLIHALGVILDAFGVRWWASAGSLLGAVRNGGLMLQDCDVDIAIWRPDAHYLVETRFRAALAAAGIMMYQLPIYLEFRFCLTQVPAAAEHRSPDGSLSCLMPYVDGHLADAVRGRVGRWHYIHQTELKYAHNFPMEGLFRQQGEDLLDERRRVPFGNYTEVWVPQARLVDYYLSTVYGSDWQTALRGRYGTLVHDDAANGGEAFWGLFAKPSGPLRDVMGELHAMGVLGPPRIPVQNPSG